MARIAAGAGTTPGAVPAAILNEGLHPIAAWRRLPRLSQTERAHRTGLSQAWLRRIKIGDSKGSAAKLRKLAEGLAAPVWALEGGD